MSARSLSLSLDNDDDDADEGRQGARVDDDANSSDDTGDEIASKNFLIINRMRQFSTNLTFPGRCRRRCRCRERWVFVR